MNIIIVGSDPVSLELAEYLVKDRHAVTLIDQPGTRLAEIGNRLDLRVVQGMPSHPNVLRSAGAENTELLVATTPNDELNITVCAVAHSLFGVPRKIARIRAVEYLREEDELFTGVGGGMGTPGTGIPVDHIISPEVLVTQVILNLIALPGSQMVSRFCSERITVAQVRAKAGGSMIGQPLDALAPEGLRAVVLAVYRGGRLLENLEEEVLQVGDEVLFCAQNQSAAHFYSFIAPLPTGGRSIYIAGGTHTADELAMQLSERYRVKLLEPDAQRAERIEARFRSTRVELFHAAPTSLEFYHEEHIENSAVVITANPYDETNIMTLLMLRRLHKFNTISVIRNKALVDMVEGLEDENIVVSPREATISALLSHIREEGVVRTRLMRQGASEVVEFHIRGTRSSSQVVGRSASQLRLPRGVSVGLVMRGTAVLRAGADFTFRHDDHVVVFVHDTRLMSRVSRIFMPHPFWIPRW